MDQADIAGIVGTQRAFFNTGKTKDLSFRIAQLALLRKIIDDNEDAICEALKLDMNKPKFEAYVGEIAMVTNEIDYAIRHLKSWAKPKRVMTPLVHFPAKSRIYSEPLGVVTDHWYMELSDSAHLVTAGRCYGGRQLFNTEALPTCTTHV